MIYEKFGYLTIPNFVYFKTYKEMKKTKILIPILIVVFIFGIYFVGKNLKFENNIFRIKHLAALEDIVDPNLKECVNETVSSAGGDPAAVTTLECNSRAIYALDGINYLPNLITLKLTDNNMRIINELGSGNVIGTEGQYSIFFDKTVKTRNYNGRVRNIVFYNDYPDEIFEGIKVGIAPNIILQTYPKYAFKDKENKVEVAFFGGSFTAIEQEKQIELLEKIGIEWKVIKTFEESYQLAKNYYEVHGNLLINYDFKTIDGSTYNKNGYSLGSWLGLRLLVMRRSCFSA